MDCDHLHRIPAGDLAHLLPDVLQQQLHQGGVVEPGGLHQGCEAPPVPQQGADPAPRHQELHAVGVTLGSREVERGAAVIVPAHHHTLPCPQSEVPHLAAMSVPWLWSLLSAVTSPVVAE